MPTLMTVEGVRVVIYPNDHPPPHVHAVGTDTQARFALNCPEEPVEVIDARGFRRATLNRLGRGIAARLDVYARTGGSCMAEFKTLDPAAYRAALDRDRERATPRATSARYDRGRGRITVRLDSGVELAFPPCEAQGLEHAGAEDLSKVEVAGAGSGLHFPTLDVDLSIAGLLESRLGSEAWMAARRSARIA